MDSAKPLVSKSARLGIVLSTKIIDRYTRKFVEIAAKKYEDRKKILSTSEDELISAQPKTKVRLSYDFVPTLSTFVNHMVLSIFRDAVITSIISSNTRVNYSSVILAIMPNKFVQRFMGLTESDVMQLFERENDIPELSAEANVFDFPLGFGVSLGKSFIRTYPPPFKDIQSAVDKIHFRSIKKRLTADAKSLNLQNPTGEQITAVLNNEKDDNKDIKISISESVNYTLNYITSKLLNHVLRKVFSTLYNGSRSLTFSVPVLKHVIYDIATECAGRELNTLDFDGISRRINLDKT